MTIIVEDGSGVPSANSYISLADYTTFVTDKGFTDAPTGPDAEGWLQQAEFAMRSMDWLGSQTYADDGKPAWPRTGAVRRISWDVIPPDHIPSSIVFGQAMLAMEMCAARAASSNIGGNAVVTSHTVKVDTISESKTFDTAATNYGTLPNPSATASSRAQFSNLLRRAGMWVIRA